MMCKATGLLNDWSVSSDTEVSNSPTPSLQFPLPPNHYHPPYHFVGLGEEEKR